MKFSSLIAVVFFSASTIASAAGLEQNKALSSAGLTVSEIELPSPGTPQKSIFSISPKIQVNVAQFNTPDAVFLTLNRTSDINKSIQALSDAGYKVSACTDGNGAYELRAEIQDAQGPAKAADLAKYPFVKEVLVNQVVYSALAYKDAPKSAGANLNAAKRKIKVNVAQPDMNDTLIGLIQHGQDIDKVVKELTEGGFKVSASQDNHGGYMVMADVTGLDAADYAIGLARYYYVTEVQVGQKVYNQLFDLRLASKSSYAVKIGTIKGGMNYSPVNVTINKVAWTITGGMNQSPVDIQIDHAAKTIKGGANHSPVDLTFVWSQEEITVEGGANASPVKYTVNWKNGLLEGYSNHSPVKLEFDMQEGVADATIVKITGYAGLAPVDLTYDKVTGHIGGGMNHSPVNIDLVNCDLYDFLNYFFLFVK
jgi:hypothetical protein